MAAELALQVLAVLLRGSEAHPEVARDLLVAVAEREQLEDLALARGQARQARTLVRACALAPHPSDKAGRHLGGDVGVSAVHGRDRDRELGWIGVLGEVALGA